MTSGERGGSVVECRPPEREVRGSRPTAAVLCPWARHFTPRKYWLITQEAMAPSRHDWKIVDWDVKPQHNQPTLWRHKILMNINEVHWNFSDNGTKETAKSRFWNFYNFWTAWNFLMRFSLLCSGEWALSFYICVFIYTGVSLNLA